MKIYTISTLTGVRKRTQVGSFTLEATANAVKNSFPAEAGAEIETIEVFEGTFEEYQAVQAELAAKAQEAEKAAAIASARAKLTPAELRWLNLS